MSMNDPVFSSWLAGINSQVGDAMRWAQNFAATQQPTSTSSAYANTNYNANSAYYGNTGTTSTTGIDPNYVQGLQMQISSLSGIVQQMMGMLQAAQQGGFDFSNAGMNSSQWNGYNSGGGYNNYFNNTDNSDSIDPAAANKALKKAIVSLNSDSSDTNLKAQIKTLESNEDDTYSQSDLTNALKLNLSQGSYTRSQTTLKLLNGLAADGKVDPNDFLDEGFVNSLSKKRRTDLATSLAADGLTDSNGTSIKQRAQFILNAVDDIAPDKVQDFGQQYVSQLYAKYVNSSTPTTNPNRQTLQSTMQLLGFKFTSDGVLDTTATQPFTLTTSS